MKEIKLDCFTENEFCENFSSLENFTVSEAADQEFSLQITNHSDNNCDLNLGVKNFSENDLSSQVKFLISSQNELFFQDSLEQFFKQLTSLGSIEAKSSKTYYFYLDFLNLMLNKEQFSVNFDLLINFDCQKFISPIELSGEIKQAEQKIQEFTQGAVLAASSSAEHQIRFPQIPLFFYLLSSLFVITFFVIIKFVNGKKKKKQKKLVV